MTDWTDPDDWDDYDDADTRAWWSALASTDPDASEEEQPS